MLMMRTTAVPNADENDVAAVSLFFDESVNDKKREKCEAVGRIYCFI